METDEILYVEKQNLNRHWILLAVFNVILIFILFIPWYSSRNNNNGIDIGLIVFLILMNAFFFIIKMETLINNKGITIKYIPFIFKGKTFLWEDMEKCYVRHYKPLLEYGGWGIRIGIFGNGMAYNLTGNKGIQIVLKNGKKILIGTRNPEVLTPLLETISNSKITTN